MEETIKKLIDGIVPWLITHGIKIILIAVAAWLLNIISSKIIRKAVRIAVVPDRNMSEESDKKREDTLIRIFTGATRIVLIVFAVLMILQEAGLKIAPILAGAGIAGLAIGFGGQYLIKDIITGLFIILENQYRIGDIVKIDDNGSERAIRNVKVKQKISGQFKILSAAENFAILRSIIDTAIKNNQNVLNALSVIAEYKTN